jgi:hypothetical protein
LKKVSRSYSKGDCNLNGDTSQKGCNADFYQMYLWTQDDEMKCEKWQDQEFVNEVLKVEVRPTKVTAKENKNYSR